MANDQHDRRRVRGSGGQIQRLHRADRLELQNRRDLRGQSFLVDRPRIEVDRFFEFHLERIVKLAIVPEFAGEVETLGVLECLAGIQKCPDALAKRIGLPIKLERLLIVELLFGDCRERVDTLAFGQCQDTA